jgi:hypothetical protein
MGIRLYCFLYDSGKSDKQTIITKIFQPYDRTLGCGLAITGLLLSSIYRYVFFDGNSFAARNVLFYVVSLLDYT